MHDMFAAPPAAPIRHAHDLLAFEIEIVIDWYLDAIQSAMTPPLDREAALAHCLRVAELEAARAELSRSEEA